MQARHGPEEAEPSTQIRALLIEDDDEVARTVCDHLLARNIGVDRAPDLAKGRERLQSGRYAALILDLVLPDGDGLEFLARLRRTDSDLPVLVLTARDGIHDRITGFERGADDYLCKPFDVSELAARLHAILRRTHASRRNVLQYADLRLNLVTRVAQRGEIEVTLSGREVSLLAFLMRNPGKVLRRAQIVEAVWGDEIEDDKNILNVYVNFLRNKLEPHGIPRMIQTVRGVGYALTNRPGELVT